jgi:hypothetical protein
MNRAGIILPRRERHLELILPEREAWIPRPIMPSLQDCIRFSPFGETTEHEILERELGRNAVAKRWIAFCTKEPTKGETAAEVESNCEATYTGHGRVETEGTAWWKAATGSAPAVISNEKEIVIPEWTGGSTAKLLAVAILTVASGAGRMVGFAKLKAEVVMSEGNPKASFAVGALEVTQT